MRKEEEWMIKNGVKNTYYTKLNSKTIIKAYFSDIGIRLYHGDVIEVLSRLPKESIDLIFADPPYNLSNDGFTCHAGRRVSVNKGEWDKSRGIDEDFQFHYNWIEACKRVLKPNGTLWISGTYHSIYACGFALQKQGWHLINDICWFKPNASPNLACRMFTACLLYTSPSPRDLSTSRMPSSA